MVTANARPQRLQRARTTTVHAGLRAHALRDTLMIVRAVRADSKLAVDALPSR